MMSKTYAWTPSDEEEAVVRIEGEGFYGAIIHTSEGDSNLRAVFYAGRDLNQTGRTRDFKSDLGGAMHWVEVRLREHLDDPKAEIVLVMLDPTKCASEAGISVLVRPLAREPGRA